MNAGQTVLWGGDELTACPPSIADKLAARCKSRAFDYLALTKPRVGVLILFTVAAGAWLAARGAPAPSILLHTILGTGLVVAGAGALNQVLERHADALMSRTENRPLASGRMSPVEGAAFGLILAVGGLAYLGIALNRIMPMLVAGLALIGYVGIYTPLKRKTTLNTLVGAVPGALPPVIGWTAVTGSFDPEAAGLFLIVFLWQVPHFLAIARIYRDEYARAGMCMLPVVDLKGDMTSRQMVSYCFALIPASLIPVFLGQVGAGYLVGALLLDIGFLGFVIGFMRHRSVDQARRVLKASLIFLPALLALLLVNGK
jgi:protoheme IX farnesyltransferase